MSTTHYDELSITFHTDAIIHDVKPFSDEGIPNYIEPENAGPVRFARGTRDFPRRTRPRAGSPTVIICRGTNR